MTDIALAPDDKEKVNAAEEYLQTANDFIIESDLNFNAANNILKEIKSKKNEYDGMRKKLKAPINLAGKEIEDFFRKPINFLGQAETIYKTKILKYHQAIEKKNNEANNQNMIKSEELTANALDALKDNDYKKYANTMNEITDLQSTTLTLPKKKGVSFKDNWKGRVTNLEAVIQGVVDKKTPPTVLKIDDSTLNQLARSTKNTIQYPGIEFYNDKIVSVKAE